MADAADAWPMPFALVAVTVKVYPVLWVRPVTVQLVEAEVQVNPPGAEVTVYPVTAEPPLSAGAVHDTTDWVRPPLVPDTPVGLPGDPATSAGVGVDDAPVPLALMAAIVKV